MPSTCNELFPRDRARSPFSQPPRVLTAGLYHGVAFPEPLGVSFNVSPGAGEIFQAPFFSFDGRVSTIMVEALPGSPLEVLRHLRYEDDPEAFEATLLRLLAEHAPAIRERVDDRHFGLTRPADLLQGAITPTVRRAWARVDDDRYAVAVGDAWVLNDPIVGQGANLGSHSAWTLGRAIVGSETYDESFCRRVEREMWGYAESVTNFTNAFLLPPPAHVVELLGAAASDRDVADALISNFADPPAMWRTIATPEGTRDFLARVLTRAVLKH